MILWASQCVCSASTVSLDDRKQNNHRHHHHSHYIIMYDRHRERLRTLCRLLLSSKSRSISPPTSNGFSFVTISIVRYGCTNICHWPATTWTVSIHTKPTLGKQTDKIVINKKLISFPLLPHLELKRPRDDKRNETKPKRNQNNALSLGQVHWLLGRWRCWLWFHISFFH